MNASKSSNHPNNNACNHTADLKDQNGMLLGSWIEVRIDTVVYIVCDCCGVKFGASISADDIVLRQAYLEQQRRMACPGCGEEPFLG